MNAKKITNVCIFQQPSHQPRPDVEEAIPDRIKTILERINSGHNTAFIPK